jgi:hypothetical protein
VICWSACDLLVGGVRELDGRLLWTRVRWSAGVNLGWVGGRRLLPVSSGTYGRYETNGIGGRNGRVETELRANAVEGRRVFYRQKFGAAKRTEP